MSTIDKAVSSLNDARADLAAVELSEVTIAWVLSRRSITPVDQEEIEKIIRRQHGRAMSAIRHKQHREAERKAIELYEAKHWPSVMEAARKISPKVCITELQVAKWIYKYKKSKSASAGRA